MAHLGSSSLRDRKEKKKEYDILYPISEASKDADKSIKYLEGCKRATDKIAKALRQKLAE